MSTVVQSPAVSTFVGPRPLSLRHNVAWTFVGNVVHAACQMGLLLVLAKLGTPEMVGQFVLGISISAPVFMLTNLGLRAVQATDSRRKYRFADYLGVRIVGSAVGFVAVVGIGIASGHSRQTLLVILLVGVAKIFESLSDVFYGLFQQTERMDWIARSKCMQGVLSLAGLATGVWLTGDVVGGAIGFVLSWLIVLAVYDTQRGLTVMRVRSTGAETVCSASDNPVRPRWNASQIRGLLLLGLPIGGTALLSSLNKHIPRYFIALDQNLGLKELGIFGALATLMMAGTTVSRALNQASCPRLAKLYAAGNMRAFRRLFGKLLAIYVTVGIAGVALVALWGEWLVELLLGRQYAEHPWVLICVMIAAGVTYVAALLDTALIAVRSLRPLVPLMLLTIVTASAGCYWLIPQYGLEGAAIALAVSKVPLVIIGLVLMWRLTRTAEMSNDDAEQQAKLGSHVAME